MPYLDSRALPATPVHVSEGEVSGLLLASYSLPADCPFESVGHAMIEGIAAGIRSIREQAPLPVVAGGASQG
jgi:hypothetical protein